MVNTLGSVLKPCVEAYSAGGAAGVVAGAGVVGDADGVVESNGVLVDSGGVDVVGGVAVEAFRSAASTRDSRPLVVLEFVEVGVVTMAGVAGALAKRDETFKVDSEAGRVDEPVPSAREFDTVATRF